jgi:hypothetical protein
MIREDWLQDGQERALIVRPDLGEAYLLFLDKGEYLVETREGGGQDVENGGSTTRNKDDSGSNMSKGALVVDPVAIDSDLSPAAAPDSITNLAQRDVTVDTHPCRLSERRATLSDGSTEITRIYKATDLSGLEIKTESESEGKNGGVRVVTQKLDIRLDVPQTLFDIPAGFKQKGR